MKVLVAGATGLIGQSLCARLAAEGHEVLGGGRRGGPAGPGPVSRWIRMDFGQAGLQDWLPHLRGVEAVVNCVGVLQDSPHEDVQAAHATGAEVLFRACAAAGIRRVVHFSAIGVERHQASGFSASKLAGDQALMALDLDWVILRPSVVLGGPVFGASALIRGLAALPVLPVMPDTGPLQVVVLEDVTETVAVMIQPEAPARVALDLAGPQRLAFAELVELHRAWLGWRPARRMGLPRWLAGLPYRLGDLAAALGWRPPLRSTARREIAHGATGDPAPWTQATGIAPRGLPEALARRPASVQERWFARLYLLKPVLFAVLALFWMLTAAISLTVGFGDGLALMHRAGVGALAGPGVIAGVLADLAIGIAIAFRATARGGLWAGIVLSCFYILAGTWLLPGLWQEPLGPLLKIWPILATHLAALAILEER